MKRIWLLFFLTLFVTTFHAKTDSIPVYKVGVKISPPFIYQDTDGKFRGVSVDLLNQLNDQLKGRIEYEQYELDQLLSAIENKEVDFSINPITVTESRLRILDFSQPYFIGRLAVIASTKSKNKILAFVQNLFSFQFLNAVLLLFLVIFIFGSIIWYFERNHNDDFENNSKGLFSGIWFSAVTMTTVGYGDKAPKTTKGRVVALIWMFTAIIIISGFTASIAASLTVENLESGIESFEYLQRKKVGTIEYSSSQIYLEQHGVNTMAFSSLEEGVNAVQKKKIDAFVYDESILKFTLKEGSFSSELAILPFTFDTQYYGFAFPRGSELVSKINPLLIRTIDSREWETTLIKYGLE